MIADLALLLAVPASMTAVAAVVLLALPALGASRCPPLSTPWGWRAVNTPTAPRTTLVTSAADGCSHQVADDAYTAGLAARRGRYTALCGHRVVAAALVCPPGPDCRGCAAAATVAVTPLPTRRGRHRGGTR